MKKMNVLKRQETASKYQNSQNAAKTFGFNTPKDNRLVKGIETANIQKTVTLRDNEKNRQNIANKYQEMMAKTTQPNAMFEDEEIHMPLEKQMSIATSKYQYQATVNSRSNMPNEEFDNTPQYYDEEQEDECYP
jgi:hypothetical protein